MQEKGFRAGTESVHNIFGMAQALKFSLNNLSAEKKYISEFTESGLIVYKTEGHCWNTPSPCVQRLGKLSLKTKKNNGYYVFYK